MTHTILQYRIPRNADSLFNLFGRKFRVGKDGVKALRLLTVIHDNRAGHTDQGWLIRLRGQIRQVETLQSQVVLSWMIELADDPSLRVLAIWLRGRCGGHFGASSLAAYSTGANVQTRKEVARALKRMRAWVELERIASQDDDGRVRRIASTEPRPYRQRLDDFATHVSRLFVAPANRELIVSDDVDVTLGRPPKPISLIRAILERIHRLISGMDCRW